VRVVKSERAGMGKTLYKTRLVERLSKEYQVGKEDSPLSVTIPLSQEKVDFPDVSKQFLNCTVAGGFIHPRIIHIDIAHGVRKRENYYYLFFLKRFQPAFLITRCLSSDCRSVDKLFTFPTSSPEPQGQFNRT
jgi:hypothetical protein